MKTKTQEPSSDHRRVHDRVTAVLREEAGDMPAQEILAITAYLVGQVIAMQDQRTMTLAMAMEIVRKNIEIGNAYAIANLGPPPSSKSN